MEGVHTWGEGRGVDVRVVEGMGGRCAFATRSYRVGDTIAMEKACLSWSVSQEGTGADDDDESVGNNDTGVVVSDTESLVAAFAAMDPASRASILERFCIPPLETEADIARLGSLHTECAQLVHAGKAHGLDVSEVFRITLAAVSNGFSVAGTDRAALMWHAAMLAHSCKPNVTYTSVDARDPAVATALGNIKLAEGEGGRQESPYRPLPDVLAFRATAPIAAGDMLSISYVTDETLCRSTEERRRVLWRSKSFLCNCERCRRPDMLRAMRCPHCGGPALPSDAPAGQSVPGGDEKGTSSPTVWLCPAGRCSDTSDGGIDPSKLPLEAETALAKRFFALRGLYRGSTAGDPTQAPRLAGDGMRLMRQASETLSPSHWIAGMTSRLIVEMLIQSGAGAGMLDGPGVFMSTVSSLVKSHRHWLSLTGVANDVPISAAGFALIAGEVHRRAGETDLAAKEFKDALPYIALASSEFHPSVVRAREFVASHREESISDDAVDGDGDGAVRDNGTPSGDKANAGSGASGKNHKKNNKKKKSRRKR